VERADNLVVIKSQPGTAPGVAAAVDAAALPEVKGSVAGNDTVLVVSGSTAAAKDLVHLVNKLRDARN
jgi:transcriptional regulator of arginine metabolism